MHKSIRMCYANSAGIRGVDDTEVGVEVDQGVVTLTGTVVSYVKKLAAQEAAHRVTGVLDVANDIRVKIPGSLGHTDTEIAQAVRHALTWDVLVPDTRITSTVTDGWVTLEGSVDRLHERDDAERAVRHLRGVHGVHNGYPLKAGHQMSQWFQASQVVASSDGHAGCFCVTTVVSQLSHVKQIPLRHGRVAVLPIVLSKEQRQTYFPLPQVPLASARIASAAPAHV